MQVFLLGGITSFPDPGNWNAAANKVECVGGGGSAGKVRNGAGGGGYGYDDNLAPAFPVPVYVTTTGTEIKPTWWVSETDTPGSIRGIRPPIGVATGGGFYPKGFKGGDGGLDPALILGGGGGGAGGPLGEGGAGQMTTGGSSEGGATLGGVGTSGSGNYASAGKPGTCWDALHGCGSGAAGGTKAYEYGGAGGAYGGATGGTHATISNQQLKTAAGGLIVITWMPYVAPAGSTHTLVIS
jgi:hypothetical protein